MPECQLGLNDKAFYELQSIFKLMRFKEFRTKNYRT